MCRSPHFWNTQRQACYISCARSGRSADLPDCRYGRKYLMVANLCCFIVLELASGFCNSLSAFLAVRALYGICMGVSQARIGRLATDTR